MSDEAERLASRLREAGQEELTALLAEHLAEIDVRAARQAFRNPFLSGPMIEALVTVPALVSAYEVRREAAFHPLTPRLLALRFVAGLYWADLVRLGADTRLHPVVRRAADLRLIERLPTLAVGERSAVARSASPTVLGAVRQDPTPRVIGAMLENPRLTEGILVPLAASETASPQALSRVAASPRWAARPTVRYALCRNPATPPAAVLHLLPMLAKRELEAVASDARLQLAVRRKAQLLCGSGGTARDRRSSD
jgi:hypothetical protein